MGGIRMDVTRMIQVAVVLADMALCQILAWPWKRMGMSLLLAVIVIKVGKAFREERERDTDERGAASEDS